MTNQTVGDVFSKIIEDVIGASLNDFEESGVGQQTLQELQQTWQQKLSARAVAQMPWDPKPAPPIQQPPNPPTLPSSIANANGAPPSGYTPQAPSISNGGHRIKAEPGTEPQFSSLPQANGYPQNGMNPGVAPQRAASLLQQQFGNQANASVNALNQRSGLALPGQQKSHGLQMPQSGLPQSQQQYTPQQYQQVMQRQQQQMQQQQQQNPRIKLENESPRLSQGQFQQPQQQHRPPAQYDGADESLDDWKAYIAQRRAMTAEKTAHADRLMHNQITELSANLESGLMIPLDQQKSRKRRNFARLAIASSSSSTSETGPGSLIPQLDGDVASDDGKPDIKEEDDEDAINSDLDDPDEEQGGADDEDDETGDSILCTYDKVQRVKNKWKCTLKDGVLKTSNKEYLFHKGQGEFEW